MSRISAERRLERLLVMIPWVIAQDGPTVEDVCRRFDIQERELVQELEMLFLCGLHPFTPDMLMEADIVDGRVYIRYADAFDRPPTFTPEEAISLVAAASAVADLPESAENEPLHRALGKLRTALGVEEDGAVGVQLAPAEPAVLAAVRAAAAEHEIVEVEYYSWGRDAFTRRRLQPVRVFNESGHWYAFASDAARADGDAKPAKTFRLDRMRSVVRTGERFDPPRDAPEPSAFTPHDHDPVVELELDPEAAWVAGQYPTERTEVLTDGRTRVSLRVSEQAWLDRLLLRVGRRARVVGSTATAAPAARRILGRYASAVVEER